MTVDYLFQQANEAGRVYMELRDHYRRLRELGIFSQIKYHDKRHVVVPEGAVSKLEQIAQRIGARYEPGQ